MHESPTPSVVTRIVPGVVDVVVLAPNSGTSANNRSVLADAGAASVAFGAVPDFWQVLTLKRGAGTRCTGAWEIVHGRIEPGERAEHAAVRELFEETGFRPVRLYNITVNAFYLHQTGTVQLALVFAAIVQLDHPVVLGNEHSEYAWRSFADAAAVLAWPREREALTHVQQLLGNGDAGPVEDVLRII